MNSLKTNEKTEINNQSKSNLNISDNIELKELYPILLENQSLVNKKDQKNETLLSYALKRKNIEIAKLIISSPLLDLTYQDNKGNTYLHLAVISQLEDIIKSLIKKGININLQNNDGNTALHLAYNTGDIIFIAALVENKVDLNIKNKDGLTPEEIQMDSIPDNLDSNYNDVIINNNNSINSENIKMNDKEKDNNIIINNNENINPLLTNENNTINESIKINLEKNENNKESNNNKNIVKNNTEYFNYIDDDNKDKENENENEKENNNNNTDKMKYQCHDNHKTSDIFDLTSSATYKEKLANLTSINSHIVGSPKFLEKNENFEKDDSLYIKKGKKSENICIYDSEYNNLTYDVNNNNKNRHFKIKTEKEKYSNLTNINNRKNSKNSKKGNFQKTFESTTSISIGCEDMDNKDKKNEKYNHHKYNLNQNKKNYSNNNNNDNKYDKLVFSSLENSKNSFNKNKDINSRNNTINLENQQNLNNNVIQNITINNSNHMDISSTLITNTIINESISRSQEHFMNSKINIEPNLTVENLVDKSKLLQKSQTSLYIFLLEIKLEKYYNILNSNGFEDIQLLIDQEKNLTAITDIQLKEAGINIPGDRAKILIRLQEKAENFIYHIPKNVYYICNDLEHYLEDIHIQKINQWLKTIKLEKYLKNFINGGYHCIELMLVQMESNNPITDIILRDDLGIDKIGYRARIINKLKEDAKKYNNKLKSSMLVFVKAETEKTCDCIIC